MKVELSVGRVRLEAEICQQADRLLRAVRANSVWVPPVNMGVDARDMVWEISRDGLTRQLELLDSLLRKRENLIQMEEEDRLEQEEEALERLRSGANRVMSDW